MNSIDPKRTAIVALLVLLFLSGCTGDDPWHLAIDDLEINETNGEYQVAGEVYMGGQVYNVTLHNPRIVLVTEDDDVVRRIELGRMQSGTERAGVAFNATLETRPRCVFIRFDSVDAPSNLEGSITDYLTTDRGVVGLPHPMEDRIQTCQSLINRWEDFKTQNSRTDREPTRQRMNISGGSSSP